MKHTHLSSHHYFAQDLIDAFAHGQINAAQFTREYLLLSGTDKTGAAEKALEVPTESELHDLCVRYEDSVGYYGSQTESVAAAAELERHIKLMAN